MRYAASSGAAAELAETLAKIKATADKAGFIIIIVISGVDVMSEQVFGHPDRSEIVT